MPKLKALKNPKDPLLDLIKKRNEPEINALPSNADKTYLKMLQRFREKYVPKEYNQIHLLDELTNPEIDHYISISNRTDGKSINYVHALLHIAVEYNIGLFFISRNMMLRASYIDLLDDVIDISPLYDRKDFTFIRTQYYTTLVYNGKDVAIIGALNDASELKYHSNYIKKFPIIIYDEFLALETEYLSDEWVRLKTIYESVDRVANRPLIGKPKIFYLGNAVNFESPILHGLKLFNILERHPINTAHIYKYDFNVMLEMNRNERANEKRNMRAFDSANDNMSSAKFETNPHNIASKNDKLLVQRNPRFIYVKLTNDYLKIWFNRDTLTIILSIESRIECDYQYNINLKDNTDNSTYLSEKYFSENQIKKIDNGAYLFENNYSKNIVTGSQSMLNYIKIPKLIKEVLRNETDNTEIDSKEFQYEQNYLEQTKQSIFKKFMGMS